MKYNLSVEMRSFNGLPFVRQVPNDKGGVSDVPMSLKDMIENSLVNADPIEFNTGEKKLEIYRLLQKIHAADSEVNLSAEEVSTIKKVVAKNMTITALGAIHDALESPRTTLRVVDEQEK